MSYSNFKELLILGQQFEIKAQQQIINYYKSKNKDGHILNTCKSNNMTSNCQIWVNTK
jgi:hypothetical protein